MNAFIRSSRGRTASQLGNVDMNVWLRSEARRGADGVEGPNEAQAEPVADADRPFQKGMRVRGQVRHRWRTNRSDRDE